MKNKLTMKNKYLLVLAMWFPVAIYSQNTCATALPITAGNHVVTVVDGTEVPAPICAANGPGATAGEWYLYTPADDYTVTVTTDLAVNAGEDTRFHVYTGTCGSLVCHSGDDDGGSVFLSIATFQVSVGTSYYIAFDNRWSSNGFEFNLIEAPAEEPVIVPVTFTPNYFPSISGDYKICVVDMNGDYLDDIVSITSNSIQIHYQQISGAFTNTTITTTNADFLPSWSMVVADFDKNGFNDLLYGGGSGVTFMKANSTGTGYTEISGSEYVFSQRSNFVDINNDGHLDAFVCHDVNPNVYYLNDGAGNLVYNQGGLGDHPEGGNYGSVWIDYDNDGDQDLFIAKCRGGASTANINELHRNDGNGVFTDVSIESNMADPVQTWSSAWNDYDNDGYMDALVGASSTSDGSHKLMRNNGDGTFSDVTAGSGWDENTSLSIEHVSYDFDNDGFTDVLGGGNKIMFNNGDMTFSPVLYDFSNGAIGDLNNDGFLDIQVGNTVYMNDGNDNNWIKINLQGIQSNINGIGARVELYGAWGKQIRDVQCGVGFRYMNTLNVHFGIGQATEIDSVRILWPSGVVDIIIDPEINQTILDVEATNALSLFEVEGQKVTLYPNPSSDFITIENLEIIDAKNLSIISHLGAKVQTLNPEDEKFDISKLASGLYVLIIETNDGKKYAESFIKK